MLPAQLFAMIKFVVPMEVSKFTVLKVAEPHAPHVVFFLWRTFEVLVSGWISLDYIEATQAKAAATRCVEEAIATCAHGRDGPLRLNTTSALYLGLVSSMNQSGVGGDGADAIVGA